MAEDIYAAEEWRAIPQFPEYVASSLGRVKRITSLHRNYVGMIMKPTVNRRGYHFISLFSGKRYYRMTIGRMILMAFVGPPPTPKSQAAHWDGDKANNRIENLRWATALENAADKKRLGEDGDQAGEANPRAKFTDAQIREIRSHPKEYGVGVRLAKQYGVCPQTINLILNGRRWTHVT
jgi:hypothetical protein